MKFSKRLKRNRTMNREIKEKPENQPVEEVEEGRLVEGGSAEGGVEELECEVVVELTGTDIKVENPLVIVTAAEV